MIGLRNHPIIKSSNHQIWYYRFDWPRTIFLTFFLAEPRATVRFALGVAFLRAVRFASLRVSLSSAFVFAIGVLYVCLGESARNLARDLILRSPAHTSPPAF